MLVVDDGSIDALSLDVLELIDSWSEFRSGDWVLLRLPSRYLGAARNAAARRVRLPPLPNSTKLRCPCAAPIYLWCG